MTYRYPLGLFEAYGVELEYMIVDAATLDVCPIADRILGSEGDLDRGAATWSNELALHVMELKNSEPAPRLVGLARVFQDEVREVNRRLAEHNAMLLPTGMHPWMDPDREFRAWPHEGGPVYRTFDRIFDCRGHGWANLQSVHLNLPFANDAEFGRLHAAIRLLLPLLPALAASSPARSGTLTGLMDTRLDVYRHNADRIPSVVGSLVPERVFTRAAYEGVLLERIYRDLKPFDPEGVLRHEWVNARGAIARFDRGTIEIRVLDVQECPAADLAVLGATAAVLRAIVAGELGGDDPEVWSEDVLVHLLEESVRAGDEAHVTDRAYLDALGCPGSSATAREIWSHLIGDVVSKDPGFPEWERHLNLFLREGCLARRIETALMGTGLREVYGDLAACLGEGRSFSAGLDSEK